MLALERPAALLMLVVAGAAFAAARRHNRGGAVPLTLEVWCGSAVPTAGGAARTARGAARALFWAAVVLAILAATGPVQRTRTTVYLDRGRDIIFAIDTSPSMSAQDFGSQSRFDAAIGVMREFVRSRPADPVGLVSFGEGATLRAPLTHDRDYLERSLDSLRIMELGDGTAIGLGLTVAAAHLHASSPAPPGGAIVLVTDGENTTGDISPAAAAEVAAELGVRVHTIGVGTDQQTVLEFTDPTSGQTRRGPYRGRPDDSLLREIAARTGGMFAWASNPTDLAAVFRQLDSTERTDRRSRLSVRKRPLHMPIVLIALASLLAQAALRRFVLREVL